MSYVNINTLHEELEQRRIQRRLIYESVLESANIRIKHINNTTDNCYLFYPVPGFISGMPIRDRPACIQYIMSRLNEMGFITRFLKPNYVYISWRHAKYHPIDPNSRNNNDSDGLGQYVNPAAAAGFRIPETNILTGQAAARSGSSMMSFSDQVRANKLSPHKEKMLAFEAIDEQFRAGNEHYNPNFKHGSIDNMIPGPPPPLDTVPSHIQLAHRPYLDPNSPYQPQTSDSQHSPYSYNTSNNVNNVNSGSNGGHIKSVSFNSKGNKGRKTRESNGPLSLDDLISPKSGSGGRNNTVLPIQGASQQDIVNRTNQLNNVLHQFSNTKSTPPSNGIPNDIIGTLL